MDEKMSYKEFLDRNDSWSAEERELCFKPMDMAGRMAQEPAASLLLAAGGPHGLLAPSLAPSLCSLPPTAPGLLSSPTSPIFPPEQKSELLIFSTSSSCWAKREHQQDFFV